MISGSLGITEPWYIKECRVDSKTQTMHIYVSVREEAKFACPKCGGDTKRYGYEKKERIWQHGTVFFVYPCYVHCRRPQIQCPRCGVQQMNAPFERKNSRQTLLFEGIAMLLIQDCPVSVVAERMGCNEKTIVRIMKHWVRKAWDKMKGAEPQCPAPVFIFLFCSRNSLFSTQFLIITVLVVNQ